MKTMLILMTRVNKMMHDSLAVLGGSRLHEGGTQNRLTAISTSDNMLAIAAFAIDSENGTPVKNLDGPVFAPTHTKMAMMGVEYDEGGFYRVAFRPFGGLRGLHITDTQVYCDGLAGRVEIAFAPTSEHEFPWSELSVFSAKNPERLVETMNSKSLHEDSVSAMIPFLDAFVSDQLNGFVQPNRPAIITPNV